MRVTLRLQMCLFVLSALLCLPAEGGVRKRRVRQMPDSLVLPVPPVEMPVSRKMNTSAFPVQINITGRIVQIQSDHNQLLPIYNQYGVLYMTARLNKGTNWLGGLPRGRYFINNRPITIN